MVDGKTTMKRNARSLPEIRDEGFEALMERLGPADALRFMHQYDAGRGDYTKERGSWLDGTSLDEIMGGISGRRKP
jgi:hypothetical protein